jgi:hypothetical protein
MLSEDVKLGVFLAMMFFGLSSLAAFIAAQVYVKSKIPGLWQQFFPGRSVGFAHDLKFASSSLKCNFVINRLGGRDVRASLPLERQVKVAQNDLHTPHPRRTLPDCYFC